MFCKLICFDGEKSWKKILQHLENYSEPYRVITNSIGLNEFLRKEDKNCNLINELIPNIGSVANDVFQNAKKMREEYRQIFENLTYNNIKIFNGFEYILLRQLIWVSQSKKILENKQNTIFIFEKFFPIYFAIMNIAEVIGYNSELKIDYIKGEKTEYIKPEDKRLILNYKNKFSLKRSVNFVKQTTKEKSLFIKIKTGFQFLGILLSFLARLLSFKILSTVKGESIKIVLDKIDKKIWNTSAGYNAQYSFFITASREDLFLRPWYPILDKFKQKKIGFQIFTSDLATAMVLTKEKIPFINLFEDVNVLTEYIKDSVEGRKIAQEYAQKTLGSDSGIAVKKLSGYLLNQAYRSVAIIIILDHLFRKMKLKSIILGTDGEMFENLAVEVSRKYKIPSYSILPAVVNPLPSFAEWLHAEKIFVYGEKGLETLKKLGYDEERVIITGNPKYDYFKTLDEKKSKLLIQKKFPIDKKKKLIVIAMSRWHKNDENWMSKLIKLCNENNLEIIIKIHPTYKIVSHELSENKIKKIKENCKNLRCFITYDANLYELLSAADLVITEYSGAGIEAVLLEKILLTVNFSEEPLGDVSERVDKYGASLYVDDYTKLEKIIFEILNENQHVENLKKSRKEVVEMYNFHNDGKAAERIFNILTNT